jgi:hypothetical protein
MRRSWEQAVRDASNSSPEQNSSLQQLIRAGIAPRRARRILREFREHRIDLILEQRAMGADESEAADSADARLGTEQALVSHALAKPELRSWARRRPILAFVVMPPLYFAAAFCASLLGLVGLVNWRQALGESMTRASPTIHWISDYGSLCLLWGLPMVAAVTLMAFAGRRREISLWPCIGVLLICFIGSLTNFTVNLPPMAQAPSLGAGLGISSDHLGPVLLRTAATAALALGLHAWMRHVARRRINAEG